jgi:hypothetical protein
MTTENSSAAKTIAAKTAVKTTEKTTVKAPAKEASKAIATPESKTAAKAKSRASAKSAAKPVAKSTVVKDLKAKKPKMIRDSFTFPKAEYAVLDALKLRAAKLGSPVKKTELLRAGVKAIAAMQDAAFLAALKAVPSLKTGRPAKAKTS